MSEKARAIFYYCPICRKNFEGQKCPQCGHKGIPVKDIPFERDYSTDPTYLDYILRKSKTDKSKE